MTAMLGSMAGLIFLLYAFYFYRIIREEPHRFELELLRSLASWMMAVGVRSKSYLWSMLAVSVLVEILYFYLTLVLVPNPIITMFTVMFIPLEIFHLLRLGLSFQRFFGGHYLLSQVFSWPLERLSAGLFFTHSLLVLATLLFFS